MGEDIDDQNFCGFEEIKEEEIVVATAAQESTTTRCLVDNEPYTSKEEEEEEPAGAKQKPFVLFQHHDYDPVLSECDESYYQDDNDEDDEAMSRKNTDKQQQQTSVYPQRRQSRSRSRSRSASSSSSSPSSRSPERRLSSLENSQIAARTTFLSDAANLRVKTEKSDIKFDHRVLSTIGYAAANFPGCAKYLYLAAIENPSELAAKIKDLGEQKHQQITVEDLNYYTVSAALSTMACGISGIRTFCALVVPEKDVIDAKAGTLRGVSKTFQEWLTLHKYIVSVQPIVDETKQRDDGSKSKKLGLYATLPNSGPTGAAPIYR